jgi:hypothetical protein
MSNEIQTPNEIPKSKILNQAQDLVRHEKGVILNLFQNLVLKFELWHSLGIWILTFELGNLFKRYLFGINSGE